MRKIDKLREYYTAHKVPYFQWKCANPQNKLAGDCVIRAISTAMNRDYYTVYWELFNLSTKTGYMVNEPQTYEKYLKQNGWVVQKQPKKADGTKYTGRDFARKYKSKYPSVILHIGVHHMACMIKGKITDSWDCTDRTVGKWWIKEQEIV